MKDKTTAPTNISRAWAQARAVVDVYLMSTHGEYLMSTPGDYTQSAS